MTERQSPVRPGARSRVVSDTAGRPAVKSQRWLIRLAVLVVIAFAALIHVMELDPSRMLGFATASMVFVGACALLALAIVTIVKLIKHIWR